MGNRTLAAHMVGPPPRPCHALEGGFTTLSDTHSVICWGAHEGVSKTRFSLIEVSNRIACQLQQSALQNYVVPRPPKGLVMGWSTNAIAFCCGMILTTSECNPVAHRLAKTSTARREGMDWVTTRFGLFTYPCLKVERGRPTFV